MKYFIQPAKWRTIRYLNKTYYLPFPKILFWEDFCDRFFCGFLDDENNVYFPCLGNIEIDFSVCLGPAAAQFVYYQSGHATYVPFNFEQKIDFFWNSPFNNDISTGWRFLEHYTRKIYPLEKTNDIPNFSAWESINWKNVLKNPKDDTELATAIYAKLGGGKQYSLASALANPESPHRYKLELSPQQQKTVFDQFRLVRPIRKFISGQEAGFIFLPNFYGVR